MVSFLDKFAVYLIFCLTVFSFVEKYISEVVFTVRGTNHLLTEIKIIKFLMNSLIKWAVNSCWISVVHYCYEEARRRCHIYKPFWFVLNKTVVLKYSVMNSSCALLCCINIKGKTPSCKAPLMNFFILYFWHLGLWQCREAFTSLLEVLP